jgi:quinol monooxygenase YgiN
MAEPILVTGTIDLDPDQRDGFIAACRELMDATHQEDGCEHYSFAADLADPGRFHISERWASQGEMEAHSASAHLAGFMGKLGGFGVRGASLTKWEGATGAPLM